MTKQELRAYMKSQERAFLASDRCGSEASALWAEVELSQEFRAARCVLIYMDIPGEVPTRDFMDRWAGKKRFLLPLVVGDSLELRAYDPSRLVEGYMGIAEPSADSEIAFPEDVDLALVPGVAFCREDGTGFPQCVTKSGTVYRMGRGKGFYDRLLPSLRCRCMGVGFSFRWVGALPLDPWDSPLK